MEVLAPITGIIWKIRVAVGDPVEREQVVVVIESMKLEIPVESEHEGVVERIVVEEGDAVNEGDVLLLVSDT
jgi:acetyl-CoA carboxylase biotin carboxyl carrier protein